MRKKVKIRLFTPVESMNPLYLGTDSDPFGAVMQEHNGTTYAEIKEDGYRMQVHKQADRIEAYTRSRNRYSLELFPELRQPLSRLPDCILDCELIGLGKKGVAGFDYVRRRFRNNPSPEAVKKYLSSGIVRDSPVCLRVFDTLYWEGSGLTDMPIEKRRQVTASIDEKLITPSTQKTMVSEQELKSWFESLVGLNYEGLVCKRPGSLYIPGQRNTDWIKVKRAETFDVAIAGIYMREGSIAQILCAIYNEANGTYETLAKVNAERNGLNREISALLEGKHQKSKPSWLALNPQIRKDDVPDFYIPPDKSMVVEISAMNVNYGKNWQSAGLENGRSYSLRIAWLKGIRHDKSIDMISTLGDLGRMYGKQKQ